MEENSTLFSLSVDTVSKSHLIEAAKWARFLGIIGFVFIFLFIVVGVISSVALSQYSDSDRGFGQSGLAGAIGIGTALSYVLIAIIAFFHFLYMFRFANYLQGALQVEDQSLLNKSFQNLKVYFRYIGIVTIISLVLMLLSVFIAILGRTV